MPESSTAMNSRMRRRSRVRRGARSSPQCGLALRRVRGKGRTWPWPASGGTLAAGDAGLDVAQWGLAALNGATTLDEPYEK
jgi:hypothetical protein